MNGYFKLKNKKEFLIALDCILVFVLRMILSNFDYYIIIIIIISIFLFNNLI